MVLGFLLQSVRGQASPRQHFCWSPALRQLAPCIRSGGPTALGLPLLNPFPEHMLGSGLASARIWGSEGDGDAALDHFSRRTAGGSVAQGHKKLCLQADACAVTLPVSLRAGELTERNMSPHLSTGVARRPKRNPDQAMAQRKLREETSLWANQSQNFFTRMPLLSPKVYTYHLSS